MKASKQVAVDDAPRVKIVDGNEGESALLINRGPDSVYVGGDDVTAANGVEVKINEGVEVRLGDRNDDTYGICAATDTATVHCLVE
jgi:hypothetical protein